MPESDKPITDWKRGFQHFPHSNVLQRTQSHALDEQNEHDEEDGDEYDHLADVVELQRRESFKNGATLMTSNTPKKAQNEEDGELLNEEVNKQEDSLHHLVITKTSNLELSNVSRSPTFSDVSAHWNEQNYVRAIKTKEENGRMNDYCLESEEQEVPENYFE
ncbi:hypothetical protein BDF14DRAFT_35927 [Spinellus fusiger]|nr:hypothetical protein BDF14DRAFT_35927 [Spinellus fusiger]